jgi:hypothetical protein
MGFIRGVGLRTLTHAPWRGDPRGEGMMGPSFYFDLSLGPSIARNPAFRAGFALSYLFSKVDRNIPAGTKNQKVACSSHTGRTRRINGLRLL